MAQTLPQLHRLICILNSDGGVMCLPPYNHVVACSANLRHWPYDTHTCTMRIGSWTHTGDQINIMTIEPGITLHGYSSNREWKLASMTSYSQVLESDCCPNETFRFAVFELMLQRHSGIYSRTVVMPAVVLMILTLITFWMEPAEADRLILATLNLVSHILFLQYLGKILPANGDQTPVIITFYRDSMFLAAVAFFTSVVAPDLKASTMDLPLWASCLSNLVLQSRFGRVLLVQGQRYPVIYIYGLMTLHECKTTQGHIHLHIRSVAASGRRVDATVIAAEKFCLQPIQFSVRSRNLALRSAVPLCCIFESHD